MSAAVGSLSDKTILVAGAGGIGSGLVRRYCEDGAAVVLGDLDRASAEATAEELRSMGARVNAILLDGSDETSVSNAVSFCLQEYGGLDGLHANFAALVDEPGERGMLVLPHGLYEKAMEGNTRGYYLCTRAALPAMLERGGPL